MDGGLAVNVSTLTLHVKDTVTIVAKLFAPDGTSAKLSSLVWQSSDDTLATVSNGLVTARSLGICAITVTDGNHGILSVNVTVLPDSIAISARPAQVDFPTTNDLVVMGLNSKIALPGFQVYDAKGHVVNVSGLTFIPPTGSGVAVASNTVTSGATSGVFPVTIVAGTDTIANPLQVLVAPAVSTDTTYSITRINGPGSFQVNKLPFTSDRGFVLTIVKSWYQNNVLQNSTFVAAPDQVDCDQHFMSIDGQGYVVINNLGPTLTSESDMKLHYKGDWSYWSLISYSNPADSWGDKLSNGDTYNFCINSFAPAVTYYDLPATQVFYQNLAYNPHAPGIPVTGTYVIRRNGKTVIYGKSNSFSGMLYYGGAGINDINVSYPDGKTTGIIYLGSLTFMGYSDANSPDQPLMTRGVGDCAIGDSGTVNAQVPTLTTDTVVLTASVNTAQSGGVITADGGSAITAQGVCWSTSPSPTIADSKSSDPTGLWVYSSALTILAPATTYYVRAYATNSAGTGYGNQVSFTSVPSFAGYIIWQGTQSTAVCAPLATAPPGTTSIELLAAAAGMSLTINNFPTASTGSFTITDGYTITSGPSGTFTNINLGDVFYTQSGTITKTGATTFTFTCTVYDPSYNSYDIGYFNSTYVISGYGQY
jgi:hypothetical protein